jgi:hypothetical protein
VIALGEYEIRPYEIKKGPFHIDEKGPFGYGVRRYLSGSVPISPDFAQGLQREGFST